MEEIEIITLSLKHIAWSLVWSGIFAIICGILIFIYPELLGMIVGLFLVAAGIVNIIAAMGVRKYSKKNK
jgi:uncharacterized membrane protein HdeD (DUF308 family)